MHQFACLFDSAGSIDKVDTCIHISTFFMDIKHGPAFFMDVKHGPAFFMDVKHGPAFFMKHTMYMIQWYEESNLLVVAGEARSVKRPPRGSYINIYGVTQRISQNIKAMVKGPAMRSAKRIIKGSVNRPVKWSSRG